MPRRPKSAFSTKGKGRCGTPGCPSEKAPEHFLCSEHANSEAIVRVKYELENETGAFNNVAHYDETWSGHQ